MDLDLWGPSCYKGSGYNIGYHWDYDDSFGCDVIEEDVLNEKYCVQVLEILIVKADNEINKLEDDLAVLESQLMWTEQGKYKEYSEICCSELKERIQFLDIAIQSLKVGNTQDVHDGNVNPLMQRPPAESLNEVIKASLRNHISKISEKANEHSDELKSQEGSHLSITMVEETSNTLSEKTTDLDPSSESQGAIGNDVGPVKAIELSNELKTGEGLQLKTSVIGEPNNIFSEKTESLIQSSESQAIMENNRKPVKGQPAKMVGKSSGSVTSKHKTGFPYEKNSNIFKFKSTRTSGGGENRVATKQKVLLPTSEQAKTRKCSEKLADAGERDTSLDASRQAVGSDRDKLRDISGETTHVGADMISSSRKSETLKSSSRPAKDQTDASEAIKPAIIENWKPSAVRKTTGQTNVKPNPFKGLTDARKEMIVYPNSYDTKPDLCKGSTDAPKRKIISSSCKKDKSLDLWKREKPSCSCKKRENKRTNLILVAESQNTVHTRMKNRELNFEAEEKDHKEKNPGGQQVKENEEEKIDDIQNAEIAAADDLNLISLLKQERKKAKRRTLSDPAGVQQPCIPSKDDPILPLVPISKRPRKTSIAGSNSLALALSCTTVKKSVKSGVYAANNLRLAPAICISPDIVSEPHDQVKKNAESILLEIKESSILEIKLSSVCGDAAKQRVDEHLQIVSSCQTEGRVTGSLSSIIAELRLLTVVDLKAIAKQHDLKGYSKLRKDALVEYLADRLF